MDFHWLQSLNLDNVEGLVVIIFTTVAAIISVLAEKYRDKSKIKKIESAKTPLIDRAFEEIQKSTDMIRKENKNLMDQNSELRDKLDSYRRKYLDQVDLNNKLHLQNEDLKEKIDLLIDKVDKLVRGSDID